MTLPAWALRMVRSLAALGLSVGLLCCAVSPASAASSAPASHRIGWLRLAHLSPNTPAVDVYLYSFGNSRAMIVLKHVSYGTVHCVPLPGRAERRLHGRHALGWRVG